MNKIFKLVGNYFLRRKLSRAIREMNNTSYEGAVDIMNKCLTDIFINYNYITDENNCINFAEVTIPISSYRTRENHTNGCCLIDNPMEVRFFFDDGNETIWDGFSSIEEHYILVKIMMNIFDTIK